MILETIHDPRDIKALNDSQTQLLCTELREFLLKNVSKTGGHLASNLGAVELTVAIHRVFDTSRDRLVFDVGHQCYTHKILTGRREQFSSLRQYGGLSGFPKPRESGHDAFIAGHSQGGPAVFNMVTNQEHGSMVKALYAASATSSYHTMVMADGWEYDISRVNIPTFLTAGTGSWDAGNATSKEQVTDDKNGVAQGICPLWSLQENYSLLPETVDKVIARKKNVDHGDSYKQFDGYMTAWFVYHLQGDTEAGKAFAIGGELSANSLYQDVQTNINE